LNENVFITFTIGLRKRAEHLDLAATFTSVSARAVAALSTLPVTTTALSTGFSG